MRTFLCLLVLLIAPLLAAAQDAPTPNSPFDFAISRSFLEQLRAQKTFLPTFQIKLVDRSEIKALSKDCEVHIAGELSNLQFGSPPFVVVEPPNVCKFLPGASQPTDQSTRETWGNLLDQQVLNHTCQVTGFPRIFTEHAQGGEVGSSNPNHVFEIHPATTISCEDAEPLKLTNFLRAFPGLRHIQANSADDCIAKTRLWVRYDGENNVDQYEFFEKRSPRCGNFAILETSSVPEEWIRQTNGGHSAIARVSADGGQERTLKIYTIAGTEADAWLERLRKHVVQPTDPRLVHGLLTYDFFAIERALEDRGDGGTLTKPNDWVEIRFPLAFIVFGPTEVVPWNEP